MNGAVKWVILKERDAIETNVKKKNLIVLGDIALWTVLVFLK